jgi:hypothetical protein
METGESKYSVEVSTELSKKGTPGENIGKILHHNLSKKATTVARGAGIAAILKSLQMGKTLNMLSNRFSTVGEEVLCLLTTSGLVICMYVCMHVCVCVCMSLYIYVYCLEKFC